MSTGQKKPDWRKGVVVSRSGKPDKPARETEALRLVRLAIVEPDPVREKQFLLSAEIASALGRANESMVDLSTFKPGRPRGSRLKNLDAPMHAFMEGTAAATDEQRPHTLARLAVEHFNIPKGQRENTKSRLVRWWNRRD